MSSTISETICQHLAEKIIAGQISPGQKIEEALITKKFNVSRSPVRDAIRLLAKTGLVEITPRKGATVVDLNIDQLTDMFETLVELEALCAKFSAQRMSAFERKQLESIFLRFETALASKNEIQYSIINEEFHSCIYQGSHNDSLQEMATNLWQRLAPFRRSIFFTLKDRMQASHNEHKTIMDAILSSDQNKAFSAMHDHVTNSSINAMEYLQNSKAS